MYWKTAEEGTGTISRLHGCSSSYQSTSHPQNRKGMDANHAQMQPTHLDEQWRNFLLHQKRQFSLAGVKHILGRYETWQAKLSRFFGPNE